MPPANSEATAPSRSPGRSPAEWIPTSEEHEEDLVDRREHLADQVGEALAPALSGRCVCHDATTGTEARSTDSRPSEATEVPGHGGEPFDLGLEVVTAAESEECIRCARRPRAAASIPARRVPASTKASASSPLRPRGFGVNPKVISDS